MLTPNLLSAARDRRGERARGIALLVVMVAFVLLYLVVYQLHFSTAMEARIAEVRYGEVEVATSLQSAALYVLTLLVEDLRASMSSAASATGSAGVAAGGTQVGGRASARPASGAASPILQTSLTAAAAGGSGKWYDYVHKNVFQPNEQQVGRTTVRIRISDGEGKLDLNRLFDYARLPGEEDQPEGAQDARDEDAAAGAAGASSTVGDLTRLTKGSRTARAGTEKKTSASGAQKSGVARVGEAAAAEAAAGSLEDYDEDLDFEEPPAARIQATEELVYRAVVMTFSVNENDYGYRYSRYYDARAIAQEIVKYVLERRRAPQGNRIFLVTELLNVPGVTREIFYGPTYDVAPGEEVPLGRGFVLRRDEFGEAVPVYDVLPDPYLEAQKTLLQDLQSQFGRYADFPGMGRLFSNALTRGIAEPPVEIDEYGREYIVQEPRPIGLRDIFTTFSTGKINLNTASVPVLAAPLLSLTEMEASAVAIDIRDYRNRFQEEIAEDGVERVSGSQSPDLGQPRRRVPTEEESAYGLDAVYGEEGAYAAPYQDIETNYFTDLQQLELIDGTEGGPEDRLRRDEGVQRVSAEDDTLFRRVVRDYQKVAVFGSTYFEAELKAKPEKGRPGRTGYLVVKRDPKKKVIEVVMWRTEQK